MSVHSEPGAVDAALFAAVLADPTLLAFVGGVAFFGLAKQGYETFVLVDRLAHTVDQNCFDEAAGETFVYLVKAVIPGTATTTARAAGARIRELLEGLETLPIVGYALQRPILELEAVRIDEVDDGDPDRHAQHWGGQYEIVVQRTALTRERGDHAIPRQTGISENRVDGRRVPQQVDAERRDG